MGILKEFREFAMRGNVIDLAVGVVIGASFQKIVTALVEKIIMPLMSFLTQGKSIADMKYTLSIPEAFGGADIKPAELGYGAFLQSAIDFAIVAFAIFLFVKLVNTIRSRFEKEKEAAPPPPTPEDVLLLREIRDSLARQTPRRSE